jgi:chorismate mutase
MTNTPRLLELALKGLAAERAKLDDEIAQIKRQLNGGRRLAPTRESPSVASVATRRRTMSSAARKRISEGMKRRNAAMRATSPSPGPGKPTRAVGLTPEGRKKLSNMMKLRWAAKRKAAKKAP